MVRLLGNNLSNRKKVYIALTAVYGIGIPTAYEILRKADIDPETKVADLTEIQISTIRDSLESDDYKLEGDLKRLISLNIKRGQRTRTNNRTSRRLGLFTRKY